MLFININHLINEYRPVQARNALVEMIRHQNDEIKVFIRKNLTTKNFLNIILASQRRPPKVCRAWKFRSESTVCGIF
jgi:hypothetical protein